MEGQKPTVEERNPTVEDNKSDEWRRKRLSEIIEVSWPPPPACSTCTIFQAPPNVVRYERESTAVAIGAFYGGRWQSSELKKYKSHCLSYLLARHGSQANTAELLQQCISLVLELEPHARCCYKMDDEKYFMSPKLAEMLLLDGCFILYILLRQKLNQNKKVDTDVTPDLERWETEITAAPMIGRLWFWNMVVYDLIKLENQIPFFVLQELFDLLKTPADKDINLVEVALELFSNVLYPARAETFVPPPSSKVHHLLHLFHSSLIPPKLLESKMGTEGAPDWIPSATVLQDAGIKFRSPKKRMEKSFLDVAFENGVMEIPPLQVDDYTSIVFSNLIAFEQCYPKATAHITTYAKFMDYLINTARDVRQLSLDGVLLNRLGTEEAAADLLNELCVQVFYTPSENYLSKVFVDVNEYYESRWHKWRATLFSKYFSNPWAITSFLAAVILLLLTVIGVVFGGLSYFHDLRTD